MCDLTLDDLLVSIVRSIVVAQNRIESAAGMFLQGLVYLLLVLLLIFRYDLLFLGDDHVCHDLEPNIEAVRERSFPLFIRLYH